MAVLNSQYLIDIQEGLGFAEQLVFSNTGQYLSDIQRAVLQKSWQGQRKTYDQIAQELGYSASYIKQTVAPKLWKLFSEALGEKVSKTNFRSVLERRQVNQESSHTQEQIGVLKQRLEPYYKGKVQSTAKQQISNVLFPNHPQSQILNHQSQQLELPEGRVPLASRFYVERVPYEFRCYEEIVKPGAFIHIKAPRQMGKTSLMVRILAHAETQGYQTVRLNLQRVDVEILTNLDKFLRWLAYNVTRKLNLKPMLDDYWHQDLGSKVSCTTYFQDYSNSHSYENCYKLYSIELVNWSDNHVMVSCNLYQRYFSDRVASALPNRFNSYSATGWQQATGNRQQATGNRQQASQVLQSL
ncbi:MULTISPECIES: AAA-like domain-containing protein [unclassified Moorena]|uniref:AAA-like domain-containing protein n=1 Tax=unclassified Moorena TaxID=2683338 RepID=UPI0013BF589C|nr:MULTISPECIES: AAA-like domain-containing protein [unclassified Moorena]NEQ15092.1 hypothetical protein [Moorena sp. SIO3E2]NES41826.1 hypothetical protein [Moorena sp. SIO2C4]NET64729.1 hypothetical protein [Moorena sp. SIO1G6]